jgi:hypothetical protein
MKKASLKNNLAGILGFLCNCNNNILKSRICHILNSHLHEKQADKNKKPVPVLNRDEFEIVVPPCFIL